MLWPREISTGEKQGFYLTKVNIPEKMGSGPGCRGQSPLNPWMCGFGGFTDSPHPHKQETRSLDTIQAISLLSRTFWGKGRFVKKSWNQEKFLNNSDLALPWYDRKTIHVWHRPRGHFGFNIELYSENKPHVTKHSLSFGNWEPIAILTHCRRLYFQD